MYACSVYLSHIYISLVKSLSLSPSKLTYYNTKVDIFQGYICFGSMPKSENIYSMGHIFKAFDKTPHRNFPKSNLNETMNNFPGGTQLFMESNNNVNVTYDISNNYNSMKVLNFVSTPGKVLSLTVKNYEACWCGHHRNIRVSYSLDLISFLVYMIASMLFTFTINQVSVIFLYKDM